jgi:hypothetical protein
MKADKFVLRIDLGNDTMRKPAHVAQALIELGKRMRAHALPNDEKGYIHDINGNTVGKWEFGNEDGQ